MICFVFLLCEEINIKDLMIFGYYSYWLFSVCYIDHQNKVNGKASFLHFYVKIVNVDVYLGKIRNVKPKLLFKKWPINNLHESIYI